MTDSEVGTEEVEGFSDFFVRVKDRLHSALYLITHDRGEAEDIAQEALAIVWERWERVQRMDRPEGYLFMVAMNAHRKRLRRTRVGLRRLIPLPTSEDPIEPVDDKDEVVRLLRSLPQRQRAALVLTEGLAFTSDEAGEILGIQGSTVRVLASRAIQSLSGSDQG